MSDLKKPGKKEVRVEGDAQDYYQAIGFNEALSKCETYRKEELKQILKEIENDIFVIGGREDPYYCRLKEIRIAFNKRIKEEHAK